MRRRGLNIHTDDFDGELCTPEGTLSSRTGFGMRPGPQSTCQNMSDKPRCVRGVPLEAEGSMNGDRWMKGSAEQNVARRPGSRRRPHPQYEPYVDEVEASETLQGKYQKNRLKNAHQRSPYHTRTP